MQAVGLGRVVLDTGRAAATTGGRVAGDSDLLSRRHFDFVPKLSLGSLLFHCHFRSLLRVVCCSLCRRFQALFFFRDFQALLIARPRRRPAWQRWRLPVTRKQPDVALSAMAQQHGAAGPMMVLVAAATTTNSRTLTCYTLAVARH